MSTAAPTAAGVAARLAEITWQVVEGDYAALRRIVEAGGGTWEQGDRSTGPVVRAGHGMSVGIAGPDNDPIGCFVQVAFAIGGQNWALSAEYRDAMRLVQKQWSARAKAAKVAAKAAKAASA